MNDSDVPWKHALKLVKAYQGEDVQLTFIKNGDHRLSEPADIELLLQTVDMLAEAP